MTIIMLLAAFGFGVLVGAVLNHLWWEGYL